MTLSFDGEINKPWPAVELSLSSNLNRHKTVQRSPICDAVCWFSSSSPFPSPRCTWSPCPRNGCGFTLAVQDNAQRTLHLSVLGRLLAVFFVAPRRDRRMHAEHEPSSFSRPQRKRSSLVGLVSTAPQQTSQPANKEKNERIEWKREKRQAAWLVRKGKRPFASFPSSVPFSAANETETDPLATKGRAFAHPRSPPRGTCAIEIG